MQVGDWNGHASAYTVSANGLSLSLPSEGERVKQCEGQRRRVYLWGFGKFLHPLKYFRSVLVALANNVPVKYEGNEIMYV